MVILLCSHNELYKETKLMSRSEKFNLKTLKQLILCILKNKMLKTKSLVSKSTLGITKGLFQAADVPEAKALFSTFSLDFYSVHFFSNNLLCFSSLVFNTLFLLEKKMLSIKGK